jgi:FkbM family methyltransferase
MTFRCTVSLTFASAAGRHLGSMTFSRRTEDVATERPRHTEARTECESLYLADPCHDNLRTKLRRCDALSRVSRLHERFLRRRRRCRSEILSVTKWFYDLGWSGINIEPYPDFHQKLTTERPRDINLNCGAGDQQGEAVFFELPVKEWSTFDPSIRARAQARGEHVTECPIPILPLNDILERHADGRAIDFLKIDVEGWERAVLSGIDLRRHRPIIIILEATLQGTTEASHSSWEDILIQAQFKPAYFDGVNKFYLQEERLDLAEHFAVPPNTFDEFVSAETVKWKSDAEGVTKLLKDSKADRDARLAQIKTLTDTVKKLEGDHARDIETLNRNIKTLTSLLKDSETDRAARFDQIQILTKHISDANAAHTTEVHALNAQVQKLESHPAMRFSRAVVRLWRRQATPVQP